MSAEEPLMPQIGTLAGARQAVEFVELALHQTRPAGEAVDSVETDNDLADVVVALANLSAVLARIAAGFAKRCGPEVSEVDLVRHIGRDQEIRDARRELDALDGGDPFDA